MTALTFAAVALIEKSTNVVVVFAVPCPSGAFLVGVLRNAQERQKASHTVA